MRIALFIAVLVTLAPGAAAAQGAGTTGQATPSPSDRIGEAYDEFLRAHLLERADDVNGAIAAYRRAMALDPSAAAIPADLANLFLRENRVSEAVAAAEAAVKLEASNREAHRVLGLAYSAMAAAPQGGNRRAAQEENLSRAIQHLERALEPPVAAPDAEVRASLARLYIVAGSPDKAIPILTELVNEAPGWTEGPGLLVEAYSAAGRSAEAVTWLESAAAENPRLYSTLGDFYARERRWADSATAYEQALQQSPRSFDLRVRMASSLLNAGSRADVLKARDALREALSRRATDERALYLLSQAERRAGEFDAAEKTARRLISQNARNPRGYLALAEALEEQRRYQQVVDALGPALDALRSTSDSVRALAMLLPHLGFAYQELGQFDRAVATFEEARRLAPEDPSLLGYLIQAQLAARNYSAAAELARAARTRDPGDLRLARFEALALRRSGRVDESLKILEDMADRHRDSPAAYVALAQGYSDSNRGAQAVKVLQDAQSRFPGDSSILFELGAVFERQKRFAESEAAFRQLIAKEPDHAPALNYLGYMLADRGERLGESVQFLKRALAIEPDNGSYLDSIGWAYFKEGKLDLALENLRRAADMLLTNSVVQDHYGDVLFRLGRYDEAISAWDRALGGDGESVDRNDIDRKIRSARQKLPKR
jgi:tetratricopeptide (TPR) repeat protein